MGVWIETTDRDGNVIRYTVTPYVGVWIETILVSKGAKEYGVTPYVGVWIETDVLSQGEYPVVSLLMWECGLKQQEYG